MIRWEKDSKQSLPTPISEYGYLGEWCVFKIYHTGWVRRSPLRWNISCFLPDEGADTVTHKGYKYDLETIGEAKQKVKEILKDWLKRANL